MSGATNITYPSLDDPDLTLARLMQLWPGTIAVFIAYRLHCVGCPISRFHTVADVCRLHALDAARFRADLRDAVSREGSPR